MAWGTRVLAGREHVLTPVAATIAQCGLADTLAFAIPIGALAAFPAFLFLVAVDIILAASGLNLWRHERRNRAGLDRLQAGLDAHQGRHGLD